MSFNQPLNSLVLGIPLGGQRSNATDRCNQWSRITYSGGAGGGGGSDGGGGGGDDDDVDEFDGESDY